MKKRFLLVLTLLCLILFISSCEEDIVSKKMEAPNREPFSGKKVNLELREKEILSKYKSPNFDLGEYGPLRILFEKEPMYDGYIIEFKDEPLILKDKKLKELINQKKLDINQKDIQIIEYKNEASS